MYKAFDSRYWYSFNRYKQLLNWVAQYNNYCGTEVTNRFIEHLGVNNEDTYYCGYWTPDGKVVEYSYRENRVINEDGYNIYSKAFVKDVKTWKFSEEMLKQWRHEAYQKRHKRYYHKYFYIPDSAYPDFRRGPWPFIHTYHYNSYRRIKTMNEKRLSSDPEFISFNRGSRGLNLPDLWSDEPVRDWRNDGWKHQGKNKHQWEHKVKTRERHKYGKGVYVEECKTDNYFDIEYIEDIDEESEE